jgi:lactate dehydrogenase-like 2-hydroxyacid dehydrogenase
MKIYLVEYVDLSFVLNLKQNHEIVDNISDADIVITRNLKIDKSFIDQAKNLKCIAIHGTGVSEVDIEYAKKRGIVVFNAPYQNYESVAEFSILLALEAARKYGKMELYKKRACILGYGHIGKRLEEMLVNAFSMDVTIYKRNDFFKEKVKDCDFIFICMSLNKDNYHFFNEERLKELKKNSILINTARGAIVDSECIIKALRENHLLCYATDVFEDEPLKMDNPLLKERVIAYPHIASNTKEALKNIGDLLYLQINQFLNNETPKHSL